MKLKKTMALFLTVMLCIMAFPVSASAADYVKYKTAADLVADLTAGWNLACSLDAINFANLEYSDWNGYETVWGNPRVTKKLFDTVRKAGFNFVRIPVSWSPHIDADGSIDKEWLDRVQEVVDYAYDEGMFVIININDPQFCLCNDPQLFLKPDKVTTESSKNIKKVWKQIAARFKNYNQRLIFEGMGEPHTEGSEAERDCGTDWEYESVNKLNKAFVETVRSSGGNNKDRLLMIPPYWAATDDPGLYALEVPDDKMVAVSIHAYQPWDFALQEVSDVTKFTDDGKKVIDNVFTKIDEAFLSKGIPVIMGEYGFLDRENTSERVKATKYYLSVAKKYGVPCAWWDHGISDDGLKHHGLLNRKTYEWYFPEIMKAIIDTAPESPFTSDGKLKAPTDFKASATQSKIVLKWNSVKNADAYRIYIYSEKTGKYETYKTVFTGQCTITGLKKGTQYKFVVAPLIKNSDEKYVKQTSSKAKGVTTKK